MSTHRLSLVGLALVVAALPVSGQDVASDGIAVARAHESWFRGLLTQDITEPSAVLSPDVTLGSPGGHVMPRQDFLRSCAAEPSGAWSPGSQRACLPPSRSELVRDALRRQRALARFEQARRAMLPLAEAQGFLTDEDVFADVS